MKKILAIIILVVCSASLLSCGNKGNNINNKYIHPKFEIDGNTIKQSYEEEYKQSWETNKNEIKEEIKTDVKEMLKYYSSEVTIVNEDNTAEYIIDNNDVIYNNCRFVDLYSNVNAVQQPYTVENLINFIVKTYKNNGKEVVYTELQTDRSVDNNTEQGAGDYLTKHESLMDREGYIDISNKYNDYAIWSISVYAENYQDMAVLNGCKSFIIYNGYNNIEVDMNDYKSEVN